MVIQFGRRCPKVGLRWLLTDNGRRLAEKVRSVRAKENFARVLVSPMQRAHETCELVGLAS